MRSGFMMQLDNITPTGCATETPVMVPAADGCSTANCATPEPSAPVQVADGCGTSSCAIPESACEMQTPAFHALAIDDGSGRANFSCCLFAAFHVERVMNAIQHTIALPTHEVVVDHAVRRKILR
jgi:hypothetical protein